MLSSGRQKREQYATAAHTGCEAASEGWCETFLLSVTRSRTLRCVHEMSLRGLFAAGKEDKKHNEPKSMQGRTVQTVCKASCILEVTGGQGNSFLCVHQPPMIRRGRPVSQGWYKERMCCCRKSASAIACRIVRPRSSPICSLGACICTVYQIDDI